MHLQADVVSRASVTSVSTHNAFSLPSVDCYQFITILLTLVICNSGIRDHIIAKSKCVCGETDVLADDLLPNKTLRDAINRILEAGNDSIENAGSAGHITGLELL